MGKSYDRIEGESAKAYAAFCTYRDMGASRSLDRAAANFYSTQTAHKQPKNATAFDRWSSRWDWIERVKDFDRDREMLLREEQRRRDIDDHDRKLEEFRAQNETIGFGFLGLAGEMLVVAEAIVAPVLAKAKAGETLEKADLDIILTLPHALKAVANYSVIGSQLAADGLLVRQLMQQLKEKESA